MAAEAEEVPLCGLHHLKFAEFEEFPEDTPDFSDVLGAYASSRRCVIRRGRGRRRGVCRRSAVGGRALSVVSVFALPGCSCAVVDEGGLSRSISEFEKQSQSGVRSIFCGVCAGSRC